MLMVGDVCGYGGGVWEVVRVRWDSENSYAATFGELLDVFWDSYDFMYVLIDDLYVSVVFVMSES